MRRKKERSKQLMSNKQIRQSNTAHPRQSLFLEKMSCLSTFLEHRKWKLDRIPARAGTCTCIIIFSLKIIGCFGCTHLLLESLVLYVMCTCTFKSHLRQLIFLRKSDCLGCIVLLCLVVCLTLLASFFLPSHLSLTCVASFLHETFPLALLCIYIYTY